MLIRKRHLVEFRFSSTSTTKLQDRPKRYRPPMGERIERFLDRVAEPSGLSSGKNLRVFWNAVPHVDDEEHPEDKNWAESAPDPDAP